MIISTVIIYNSSILFFLLLDTQLTKVDYNAAHNENTYVTETRAINDYLLNQRYCNVFYFY